MSASGAAGASGASGASEPHASRPPRPPWAHFREALDSVGFHPSRRLGQNFLLDENAARAIARDAAVGQGDLVLEVGPGCGFLSVHLAHAGVRLLAVEVDERLAPIAARFLEPYPAGEVLLGDVLAGKRQLNPMVEERLPESGPWHLVSNLPYAIAAPLLALVARRSNPPASFTVLVQREVGERLVAAPGTRAWGPLSVAIQTALAPRILRQLGPSLFWPRPKVDSALVRAEVLRPLAPHSERERCTSLAARLLRHRRQGLVRVLGDLLGNRDEALVHLADLSLDPRGRAECLDLEQLRRLASRLGDRV